MTQKELERQQVVERLVRKDINGTQAATMLGITVRHIKRLKAGYKQNGPMTLIHKGRGKPSNRKMSSKVCRRVIELMNNYYKDFKPTFATEKLAERHGIVLSVETVRKLMIDAKLWKARSRKNKKQYRHWRPRKEYYGQMQQFDGSYHDWLEGRDSVYERLCLLISIDDATGRLTKARFELHEGIDPVFRFWREYLRENGKPRSVYLDKLGTYKMQERYSKDDPELMTQFQRVMKTFGITLIPAGSPQAKGRVERVFHTLQDRLIKEMRLAKICNKEIANKFLEEEFIDKFNRKYAVRPERNGNIHRKLTKIEEKKINNVFSKHSYRYVNKDFTIRFKNQWYQLGKTQETTVYHHNQVLIEEWIDGSVHISLREIGLNYSVLPTRPKRMKLNPILITQHKTNWAPPEDHPWRRYKHKQMI